MFKRLNSQFFGSVLMKGRRTRVQTGTGGRRQKINVDVYDFRDLKCEDVERCCGGNTEKFLVPEGVLSQS